MGGSVGENVLNQPRCQERKVVSLSSMDVYGSLLGQPVVIDCQKFRHCFHVSWHTQNCLYFRVIIDVICTCYIKVI